MLRGKCIALNAYINKKETYQISNLTVHLQKLEEKKEQNKPKSGKRTCLQLMSCLMVKA